MNIKEIKECRNAERFPAVSLSDEVLDYCISAIDQLTAERDGLKVKVVQLQVRADVFLSTQAEALQMREACRKQKGAVEFLRVHSEGWHALPESVQTQLVEGYTDAKQALTATPNTEAISKVLKAVKKHYAYHSDPERPASQFHNHPDRCAICQAAKEAGL